MQKEAAKELAGCQPNRALTVSLRSVAVAERDVAVLDSHQAAVSNRHSVRVKGR